MSAPEIPPSATLEPAPVSSQRTGLHQPHEMSLVEHLAELRRRLLISIFTLAVCVLGAFFLSVPAITFLKQLAPSEVHFVQLSPGEVFMASFRLSVFLGFVAALPIILYQALRFVLPGLTAREKRFLVWIVFGGALLFGLGMAFAYYAVIPPALVWLIDFGQEVAESQISIAHFIAFCTSLILLTGVMFELPMVLLLLSFTGLVTAENLMIQWRAATIIIFLVAAIVTPSQDPFSMALVGVAMFGLYWVSIFSIKLFGRRPTT
jgi:sec-independent protein translocase protein TatC